MVKDTTCRRNVEIWHDGLQGQVIVDGVDLTNAVRAITWRTAVDERPSMDVELRIFDVTTVSSKDTEMLLPNETIEALIALGWTPPDVTVRDIETSETKPQVRGPFDGKDAGQRGGG